MSICVSVCKLGMCGGILPKENFFQLDALRSHLTSCLGQNVLIKPFEASELSCLKWPQALFSQNSQRWNVTQTWYGLFLKNAVYLHHEIFLSSDWYSHGHTSNFASVALCNIHPNCTVYVEMNAACSSARNEATVHCVLLNLVHGWVVSRNVNNSPR